MFAATAVRISNRKGSPVKVMKSAGISPRKSAWRSSVLFFVDGFIIGVVFIRFGKPVVHTPPEPTSSNVAVVQRIDVRDLLAAQHDYGLRHPSWRIHDRAIIEYPAPGDPNDALELDSQSLGREIVSEIKDSVAPDTWIDSGGSSGVISISDGTLVVTQTPENLRQIHKLLNFLRADVAEWPKGQRSRTEGQ